MFVENNVSIIFQRWDTGERSVENRFKNKKKWFQAMEGDSFWDSERYEDNNGGCKGF